MYKVRVAVLAASVSLFAGAMAFAQATPQVSDITVTGSVDQMCILGDPAVNVGGATNVGSVTGPTIAIANLSDEQDLTTKSTDFDVTLSGMCNTSHTITISSDRGGLWRQPAGLTRAGFANGVPYRATVDWASLVLTLSAPASGEGEIDQSLDVSTPNVGDLTMHFHIDQNASNAGAGAPLVAGSYRDVIRLTIGAQ